MDGTAETGEPFEYAAREAAKALPPLGRPFAYNFPLLHTLRARVGCRSLLLFTAYDAQGGAAFGHAVRLELREWLETQHGTFVEAAATPLSDLMNDESAI